MYFKVRERPYAFEEWQPTLSLLVLEYIIIDKMCMFKKYLNFYVKIITLADN